MAFVFTHENQFHSGSASAPKSNTRIIIPLTSTQTYCSNSFIVQSFKVDLLAILEKCL
jgi:hypothetical protein